ncbi:MAG TPA: hypothetical protein VFH19_06005 [Nitrososphaeraceae archaeon]|nr:hypothetical protein [Nitrososphaeraceae archaeon]
MSFRHSGRYELFFIDAHVDFYEVSVAHRTGGWKGRLAALERAGSPFLLWE